MDASTLTTLTTLSGYIAFALLFISFQVNDRKQILGILILAMICLAMHQFLLGALAGAVANGLTILRNIFFRFKDRAALFQLSVWPLLFSGILVASSLFLWQDWYSFLPALAVIASTYALWSDTTKTIRILSLIGPLLWLPYGIMIGSTPTILIQLVIISSVLIAMVRFDRKKSA